MLIDAEEYVRTRQSTIQRYLHPRGASTAYLEAEADVGPALALCDRLGCAGPVALRHVVLKATALALREVILLNYDYDGLYHLRPNDKIDIGSVVCAGENAFHVVVPDADRLSLVEIARAFEAGLEHAQERSRSEQRSNRQTLAFLPASLLAWAPRLVPFFEQWILAHYRARFGSFTVTDLSGTGVTESRGQLAFPALAALDVLALRHSAEGEHSRQMLPLSLQFDQKVLDASIGARFLKLVKQNLESPEKHCLEPSER